MTAPSNRLLTPRVLRLHARPIRMRSAHFLPLFLVITLGCGRYRLDHPAQASVGGTTAVSHDDAGSGGRGGAAQDAAGSSGEAGASPSGGASASGEAGADSTDGGDAGMGGSAGSNATEHDRWLASETFVSSSSAQTALSLVDLTDPDADPVLLAGAAGSISAFSGNGRWLLYASHRDDHNSDVYLVDLSRKPPFKPQFVLITGPNVPCKWAPDSSSVACIVDLAGADAPPASVRSFDTSGAVPGPAIVVGMLPAKSAGAATNAERELTFLDRDNLVFSYGANDFARATLHGSIPVQLQTLGFGGGTIAEQAPDGRLLIKRVDSHYPLGSVLADFRAGQAEVIDPSLALAVSSDFSTAYALQPPAVGDTGGGTYLYYSISGTHLALAGTEAAVPGRPTFSFSSVFVGNRTVHMQGERVVVVSIGAVSAVDQVVPGNYDNVNDLEVDPTGTWLYIGSGQFDAQQKPIAATAKQWLSRLLPDGPAEAQLIGQGYAVGNIQFAPNGQRLVLSGYDTKSALPVAFWLYDLEDAAHITGQQLDLPLNWSDTRWSPDSTYVSFIGGAPGAQVRPLYVVDARLPAAPPRLITQCGAGSTSPSPACPAAATFQP